MVHYFKLAGQRIALDEASGYTETVDDITYKMLVYLTLPFPETCPSAIRYDMAKYDSQLVEKTYQTILRKHREGKLYTDVPFAPEQFPKKQLVLSSSDSPAVMQEMEDGFSLCLTDTACPEAVRTLIAEAKKHGATVTVRVTDGGVYSGDVLLYPAEQYAAHQTDAETVGVWFAYDAAKPELLKTVTALADDGVTVIDAFPKNPDALVPGAQTGLLKEISKTAKELFLRAKEKRPVVFLPFASQTGKIRCISGSAPAFSSDRCRTCPHRMVCGGDFRNEALCEIREACADAEILLTLCV